MAPFVLHAEPAEVVEDGTEHLTALSCCTQRHLSAAHLQTRQHEALCISHALGFLFQQFLHRNVDGGWVSAGGLHLCAQPRQLLLLPEEFLQGVLQHRRQGLGRIVSSQLRGLLPSPLRFHLGRRRQLQFAPPESLLGICPGICPCAWSQRAFPWASASSTASATS